MDDAHTALGGANANAQNSVEQPIANQNADLINVEYGVNDVDPGDDIPSQVHSFGI